MYMSGSVNYMNKEHLYLIKWNIHRKATPDFIEIQAVFDRFKHIDLCTRWTDKGFKGTVVNRALPSLHEVSLTITD